MTVEILDQMPDGRPAEAAFRFDKPLEDPSLRWLAWTEHWYQPFTPPPVGTEITIQPFMPRPRDLSK